MEKWGIRFKKLVPKVKPQDLLQSWKIYKGDQVQVMSGKCKGQYGKIIGVRRDINSVLISGLNLVKRHLQPAPNASEEERRRGNIVQIENPIHISNVALIDPSTKRPTKVKWLLINGEWQRVSKETEAQIPLPEVTPRTRVMGPYDTDPEQVLKVTFKPSLLSSPIPSSCNHI